MILILVFGCTNDTIRPDCSLVLCATNDPIQLEVIQDGTNIFVSGEITTEDVTVLGTGVEEARHTVYNNTQGAVEALLTIQQFGQVEDRYTYTIQIQSSEPFDIEVVFELSGRDQCCGQRLLIQQVSSDDVTVQEMPGHITILLD